MIDVRLVVVLVLLEQVQLQQGVELSHGVYPAHSLASFRQLLTSR